MQAIQFKRRSCTTDKWWVSSFDKQWSYTGYATQTFHQPHVGAQKTITTTLNRTDNGKLCFVKTLRSLKLISLLKIDVRQHNQSQPFKVLIAMRHRTASGKQRTAIVKCAVSYLPEQEHRKSNNRNTNTCLVLFVRNVTKAMCRHGVMEIRNLKRLWRQCLRASKQQQICRRQPTTS
jgi:hypothetical protein